MAAKTSSDHDRMAILSESCRAVALSEGALGRKDVDRLARLVPDWRVAADGRSIERLYKTSSYLETLAFVQQAGTIAQQENHHPEIFFVYTRITLRYSTHSVGGLSRNDFICAAKVDASYAALSP